MNGYNKFMEWFWLGVGLLILIGVTVMGFLEGFNRWYFYYILAFMALATYFMRRWMRKRMEKHLRWMEEQKKLEEQQRH